MGFLIGLAAGWLFIVKLSVKVQVGLFGAVLGMGADGLVGLAKGNAAASAINSLASLIASLGKAIAEALSSTHLPEPPEVPVAAGLWACVVTIGLVALAGSIEKGAE